MRGFIRRSGIAVASLAILTISAPAGAHAQAGALGAAAALGAAGASAHSGAPVFTESGRVLEQGRFAGSAVGGYTTGTLVPGTPNEEGWSVFQLLVSGFFAPAENLTLGAILPVVNSVSFDNFDGESGIGDLNLYGKYRFAGDDMTDISVIGQLALPTGKEGFGLESVAIAAGLGASRQTDWGSLHASGSVIIPTDDLDGDPYVALSGAGVFGLSDQIGLSAEGSLLIGDETALSVGPAIRFRASDNVFIDGGLILPLVVPNDDFVDVDLGLLFGVNIGG